VVRCHVVSSIDLDQRDGAQGFEHSFDVCQYSSSDAADCDIDAGEYTGSDAAVARTLTRDERVIEGRAVG